MTRDDLLTECAMKVTPGEFEFITESRLCYGGTWMPKVDYMKRRAELINEPSDADAPKWLQWKAQDASGRWWFYQKKPFIDGDVWSEPSAGGDLRKSSWGKIPAGHDWRTTLREVKRMKRDFNPTSSSLTDSQSRAMAAESGTCSDGEPCRPNYCDECPNAPEDESEWVLLDRRLNGRDAINPNHYRAGKVECIDALEAATVNKHGIDAVCTANAIKYLWRYESKGGIEDVRKARWYLDRLEQHLGE